jgi:hypothetical protein
VRVEIFRLARVDLLTSGEFILEVVLGDEGFVVGERLVDLALVQLLHLLLLTNSLLLLLRVEPFL